MISHEPVHLFLVPLPAHRCQVLGSPWQGVYSTHIASARHYGKHSHAAYGVGMVESGAQTSASARGSVDAYAGDLIATNPGEVHDGRPLGGLSRRWRMVYLEPGAIAWMAGEPAAAAIAPDVQIARPVFRDMQIAQALRRLWRRLEDWNLGRNDAGSQSFACEEILVEICGLLLQRHATAAPSGEADGNVTKVRDRLADDPLDAPTLSELATLAGLSKFQLLRRFQKVYGITPHAWLLQQRAERARGLIRDGTGLALAAAAAGFADQSHMTRIFARQFGFTPGAWHKAAAPPRRLQ